MGRKTTYTLKKPAEAIRYELNHNEAAIAALIRTTGRDGFSYSNASGALRIYNGGQDIHVADSHWVVSLGGGVCVMTDDDFQRTFSPSVD